MNRHTQNASTRRSATPVLTVAALVGLVTVATVATGCREKGPEIQRVNFRVSGLVPATVYNAGGDTITVDTENACAPEHLTATLAGQPVTLTPVGPNRFTFVAPAAPSLNAPVSADLQVRCAQHPTPETHAYEVAEGTATLLYDPNNAPPPRILGYRPAGEKASVLAPVELVFSQLMDHASLTAANVGVEGVEGTIEIRDAAQPARTTVFFKQSKPLAYDTSYTVFVRGGDDGVRSATGKTLAEGDRYTWTFRTRFEGEGTSFPGEAPGVAAGAAAGSVTQSAQYKLYSVTGQAPPPGIPTGKNKRIRAGVPKQEAAE